MSSLSDFHEVTLSRYTKLVSDVSKTKKQINEEIIMLQDKKIVNVSAKQYIKLNKILKILQAELDYTIFTLQVINTIQK